MPPLLIKLLASFFFTGKLPWCPGTFGSLVGLGLAWGLDPLFAGWFLVVFCLLGFWISDPARRAFHSDDPKEFVLDEVCGMMLAVLWLPKTLGIYLAGFVLFRILDTLKPWPISLVQKSKNPLAIMGDDLLAGIGVNLILRVLTVYFA